MSKAWGPYMVAMMTLYNSTAIVRTAHARGVPVAYEASGRPVLTTQNLPVQSYNTSTQRLI